MGDASALRDLNPSRFTDEHVGFPTVTDLIKALKKNQRDSRPEFKAATFNWNGVTGEHKKGYYTITSQCITLNDPLGK